MRHSASPRASHRVRLIKNVSHRQRSIYFVCVCARVYARHGTEMMDEHMFHKLVQIHHPSYLSLYAHARCHHAPMLRSDKNAAKMHGRLSAYGIHALSSTHTHMLCIISPNTTSKSGSANQHTQSEKNKFTIW